MDRYYRLQPARKQPTTTMGLEGRDIGFEQVGPRQCRRMRSSPQCDAGSVSIAECVAGLAMRGYSSQKARRPLPTLPKRRGSYLGQAVGGWVGGWGSAFHTNQEIIYHTDPVAFSKGASFKKQSRTVYGTISVQCSVCTADGRQTPAGSSRW